MSVQATLQRRDFLARIEAAEPGDKIIYHVGDMIVDRYRGPNQMQVHSTANAAWDLMMAGKVYLSQKRITDRSIPYGDFNYVATKRAPPYNEVEWIGCYDPTRAPKHKMVRPVEGEHGQGPIEAHA